MIMDSDSESAAYNDTHTANPSEMHHALYFVCRFGRGHESLEFKDSREPLISGSLKHR